MQNKKYLKHKRIGSTKLLGVLGTGSARYFSTPFKTLLCGLINEKNRVGI